jgi:hypothetical protein
MSYPASYSKLIIFIIFYYWWGGTKSTRYCGHLWPIVQAPDDRWGWLWSNWWNEDWQGKPKYSEKTCPSATLSTTNPTWPDLGSNPGRRGGKPATNRLSYGAAYSKLKMGSFQRRLERSGHSLMNVLHTNIFLEFFQWLFQPIQGPGLLFSYVIIFHRW